MNTWKNLLFHHEISFLGFIPNDEEFDEQWYLTKIMAHEAWEITMGSEDIIVAVLDGGLDITHDDILDENYVLENVYHNPGEDEWENNWEDPTKGDSIDTDGNGKIDDWKGWDYISDEDHIPPLEFIEDNNVIPAYECDKSFHGTAVSSIIAAKTNNLTDIAGIAGGNFGEGNGGVKLLPVKLNDWIYKPYLDTCEQWSSTEYVAEAIDYAREMGADIINMSFKVNHPIPSNISAAMEAAA